MNNKKIISTSLILLSFIFLGQVNAIDSREDFSTTEEVKILAVFQANAETNNPGLKRLGNSDIKDSLIKTSGNNIVEVGSDDGFTTLGAILKWVKNSLTNLLMLVSVTAFLFVGIRLAMTRGNPEEFKKGLMHLIYTIIGIFLVGMAWALVTLVAGINI